MSTRRRGPAPRPEAERRAEAARLRTWDASPNWLSEFEASLVAGLRACPSWPGVAADHLGGVWTVEVLPQARTPFGYAVISLGYTQQLVHRLVCAAWRGLPPTTDLWVLHRDGDATNNRWTNLEWGTPLENSADRRRHGTDLGQSPNGSLRQAARAASGVEDREAGVGPLTRTGDVREFLGLLQSTPARAKPVPDGQGLFATEEGTLWRVRQAKTHIERGYPRLAVTPHRLGPDQTRLVRVHLLVADAHLGRKPSGHVTRHLDGNPLNNRADNLTYGTMAENMADRDRHGRTQRGADHAAASLTDADVADIRERYARGDRVTDIAADHAISSGHASNLATGKWRKDAPGPISPLRGNPKGEAHPRALLDDGRARAIHADLLEKKRLAETFAIGAIASRVALAPAIVRRAINNPASVSKIHAPDLIKAKLLAELAARQAADLDRYRDEAIAARHEVDVHHVQSIANGAWGHVTGGKVALGCHLAPRRGSRTSADPGTIELVFRLLKEQQEAAARLATLTSTALAARFGLTKSQVDDASAGKRPWDRLPLTPDNLKALRAELAERERLRSMTPTREVISLAAGLSEAFIKAVSAGHAWREEAAKHGYTPRG